MRPLGGPNYDMWIAFDALGRGQNFQPRDRHRLGAPSQGLAEVELALHLMICSHLWRVCRSSRYGCVHQGIDLVGDALRGFAQLPDGPVGRVPLGDVVGPDVVDQPLGQSARQQQVAFCHCDETIPQSVVPELRAARLADQPVEMSQVDDMARGAGGGREHPVPKLTREGRNHCPAAFEDGGQLPGDGQFQGRAGLGFVNAEDKLRHVHALPPERQHLVQAHAGIQPEPERVPGNRRDGPRLDAFLPARQHLRRSGDPAPLRGMILAAAGAPQLDRVAQALEIDAGPAIDRTQERYRHVGRRPTVIPGEAVETVLYIPAADGVERTHAPVGEIAVNGGAKLVHRGGVKLGHSAVGSLST